MNISYNWIREFVEIDASAEEAASALTMSGIEVEGLIHSTIPDEIIAARIIKVFPHPSADKLSICMVDTGGPENVKVVCGAPNAIEGLLSAYAPEGATVGEFHVKRARIRGEDSFGILLSEKEMGLTDDHSGIMELDEEIKPGQSLVKAMKLEDWVLEINVTPNRGDCLSVLGIARELSAIYRKELNLPVFEINEDSEPVEKHLSVEVLSREGCPRYCARHIKNIEIMKSPFWMRRRLFQSDVRAINNIVDITNYVMIEYGQPLHAFDHRFLDGKGIIVRKARDKEKFVTLDSVERVLTSDDLLICDKAKPIALAGVMGGENSEVKEDSADITLESAFFNPLGIRRTSRMTGLSTEASYRFERGIDPEIQARAADRASWFMQELGKGKVAKGSIDVNYYESSRRPIILTRQYLEKVLGITDFSDSEVGEILTRLDCKVEGSGGIWKVEVPLLRHDLEYEIDLVEEFIRIHGMDKIIPELPAYRPIEETPDRRYAKELRIKLASMGFNEIITYSFISPVWKKWFSGNVLELKNPLSEDLSVMRPSLIPGLATTAARNKNLQNRDISIFEAGRCFFPNEKEKLPVEMEMLGIAISGAGTDQHWSGQRSNVDFYDIKGISEALIPGSELRKSSHLFLKPGIQADIIVDGQKAGLIGALSDDILKMLDINEDIFIMENIQSFLYSKENTVIKTVPRFPATWRDLSLVADEGIEYAVIEGVILSVDIPEIRKIIPVDIYCGDKLPHGKKGITVRITYQSLEKTLEDRQINKWQDAIIQKLFKGLGISLR